VEERYLQPVTPYDGEMVQEERRKTAASVDKLSY